VHTAFGTIEVHGGRREHLQVHLVVRSSQSGEDRAEEQVDRVQYRSDTALS
jgi:hypothetical protein